MNKIYQKSLPDTQTSANPQLGVLTQAVIAAVVRQSRNEKDLYVQTGSRVRARDDKHRRKGFTLIELLVVVLIIGVLAAMALPQYRLSVEKAKAMQAVTLLRAVKEAEEVYYMERGGYTSDLEALGTAIPADLKDFEVNQPGEWNEGRFAFRNKTYGYYLVFSGSHRVSSSVPAEVLGKLYCGRADGGMAQWRPFTQKVCASLASSTLDYGGITFYLL